MSHMKHTGRALGLTHRLWRQPRAGWGCAGARREGRAAADLGLAHRQEPQLRQLPHHAGTPTPGLATLRDVTPRPCVTNGTIALTSQLRRVPRHAGAPALRGQTLVLR